jgi:hypothetical protein
MLVPGAGRGRIDPTAVLDAVQKRKTCWVVDVLTTDKMAFTVFRSVMPFSLAYIYRRLSEGPIYILYYEEQGSILSQFYKLYHHPEDESSTLLRNVGRFLRDYMTSHLRRRKLSAKYVC